MCCLRQATRSVIDYTNYLKNICTNSLRIGLQPKTREMFGKDSELIDKIEEEWEPCIGFFSLFKGIV